MKKIFVLALVMVFSVSLGTAPAFSQESDFYKATQLYKDGKYKEAISTYEDILKSGKTSGALYYNLGNSYFKDGQRGKAILNYERAKALMPRDSDVDFNLKYALSQVDRRVAEKDKGILSRLMDQYSGELSLDELMKIMLLAYFLLCAGILAGLFWKWPRKRLVWTAACLGLILVAHTLIFTMKAREFSQTAVVVENTDAQFEPIDQATVHFQLPEGTSVTILEQKPGWLKIRRADGKTGWTNSQAVEAI